MRFSGIAIQSQKMEKIVFSMANLKFNMEVNNSYSVALCCCWKSDDLWVNNWLAWYCRYCRQLVWMIFSESNVKVLISSNSYPLGEFPISILWKCFHDMKIKPKIFQSWLDYKIHQLLGLAVQWYNLIFWALAQT